MHVSSLLSAAPSPPRTDAAHLAPGRDPGFESVYADEDHRPAAPDRPREKQASRQEAERSPQDRATTDADRASAEAEQPPEPKPADGGQDDVATAADLQVPVDAGTDAPIAVVPFAATEAATPSRPVDGTVARQAGPNLALRTATSPDATANPDQTAPALPAEAETPAPAAKVVRSSPPAADPAVARPAEVIVRRAPTDAVANPDGAAPVQRGAEAPSARPVAAAAQSAAFAARVSDTAPIDAADPMLADLAPTETRSTADHVARTEATVRHDTPRPVMQQVADAARALRDGPVELSLKPEELGSVRMTLQAGPDGAMTMSLQAERPETLELIRRHIGELARELQSLGFSNLSFSFGQDRAPAQPSDLRASNAVDADRVAAIPLAESLATRPAMLPASGGLDLRL